MTPLMPRSKDWTDYRVEEMEEKAMNGVLLILKHERQSNWAIPYGIRTPKDLRSLSGNLEKWFFIYGDDAYINSLSSRIKNLFL